jgi:CheY-like chemotaxis protein
MSDLVIKTLIRLTNFLLVEDNEGDIFLTQEAFRSAGISHHLWIARDGEEAMSMLRREGPFSDQPRPHLVLLDLNLPRLDGSEVLGEIRADPELATLPVVVMSHSEARIDSLRHSGLQADGYTVKPVSFDHLRDVVSAIDGFGLKLMTPPAPEAGATQ